jgi:hypothetical protein
VEIFLTVGAEAALPVVPVVAQGYNQQLIRQAALPYTHLVVQVFLLTVLLTELAEMVAQLIQTLRVLLAQQVSCTFLGREVKN